jgi:cellobiose epimerase
MSSTGRLTLAAVCALSWGCVDPGADGLDPSSAADIESSSAAVSISQPLIDAFAASLKDDLLTPYYPTAHDGSYGGFVEDRSGTWALQQDGDKFVVAQARYTWTASKASQFYATSNPTLSAQYKASAAVGFAFVKNMWQSSTSGFALMADRNGSNRRNSGKESFIVYGNSFGMYAAAAYYAASGDANALTLATNAFTYLDTYFYDTQYGGYYITASDKRKETNTNVHVLEALIELYGALPTSHSLRSTVASRLSQLVARFHDYAIHCPATNDCFAYPVMNQNWSASTSDVSFGHDLELSMLMVQAIVALGQDPVASPYITKIKKVVDFTFSHGGYSSAGGFYYTGTYSNGNVSINDGQFQWWPQAEGVGALCRMRSLFPSDTTYEPLLSKSWGYINTQFIDHTNHGWVRQAGDWNIAKAWEWHCNYHNGRALMNCLSWLSGTCTPATCTSLGAACGTPSNGCGGTLSCGTCPTGQTCNASFQCVASCTPSTCASLGAACGSVSDGCGGTLSCGTCPTGQTCNASHQCVASCTPSTCASLGAACGSVSDGCGGTLSCGTCPTGQTCNASHQCVTPTNTAPVVNAGADRTVTLPSTLTIAGTVTDDGLPTPPTLTITWSKTSGPGTVTFSPTNAASTTITFSAAGTYVLRLTASDGALSAYDEVQVTVSSAGSNPCDGLCTNPTTFTMSGSYSSGNLGTGAVCRQTKSVVHGGNCGNFASSRSLSVNGTKMTCSGGNWSAIPAARNGGYCISTTSGDYSWAFFTLW